MTDNKKNDEKNLTIKKAIIKWLLFSIFLNIIAERRNTNMSCKIFQAVMKLLSICVSCYFLPFFFFVGFSSEDGIRTYSRSVCDTR